MKKIFTSALLLLMATLVVGCTASSSANLGETLVASQGTLEPVPTVTAQPTPELKTVKTIPDAVMLSEIIHFDLSGQSKTMAFATVYDMVMNTSQYIGKTIKLRGTYQSFLREDTQEIESWIVVVDNAACCEIGMEFILTGENSYPDNYPPLLSEIELLGLMSTVEYEGNEYPCLIVNEIKTIQ